MKRGWSSVDFEAVNNIFHLESKHQDIVVATKNNSQTAFYDIRDVVFDSVSEKIQEWFRKRGEGEVREISVTLDKVTVQRTSYTVLLTYFFWEGKIHVLLNSLMVMKPGEYDSEGTARAVVKELMATLGISRAQLAIILLHFAYDGVYATKEERVGGGGSLNLVKFVAAELGLQAGEISGTWDIAHQLQIIWKNGLKQNPKLMAVIKVYFEAMSAWVRVQPILQKKRGTCKLWCSHQRATRKQGLLQVYCEGWVQVQETLPACAAYLKKNTMLLSGATPTLRQRH